MRNRREAVGGFELLSLVEDGELGSLHIALDGANSDKPVLLWLFDRPNMFAAPSMQALKSPRESPIPNPCLGTFKRSGVDQGLGYAAYDRVPGLGLSEILGRCIEVGTSVPVSLALWMTSGAAAALDTANDGCSETWMPHGFLMPNFVLVMDEGPTCIFGHEIADALLGWGRDCQWDTPLSRYVAPEVRDGSQPDACSDSYALGCILLELLTGAEIPSELEAQDALCHDLVERESYPPDLAKLIEYSLVGKETRWPSAKWWLQCAQKVMVAQGFHPSASSLSEFLEALDEGQDLTPLRYAVRSSVASVAAASQTAVAMRSESSGAILAGAANFAAAAETVTTQGELSLAASDAETRFVAAIPRPVEIEEEPVVAEEVCDADSTQLIVLPDEEVPEEEEELPTAASAEADEEPLPHQIDSSQSFANGPVELVVQTDTELIDIDWDMCAANEESAGDATVATSDDESFGDRDLEAMTVPLESEILTLPSDSTGSSPGNDPSALWSAATSLLGKVNAVMAAVLVSVIGVGFVIASSALSPDQDPRGSQIAPGRVLEGRPATTSALVWSAAPAATEGAQAAEASLPAAAAEGAQAAVASPPAAPAEEVQSEVLVEATAPIAQVE